MMITMTSCLVKEDTNMTTVNFLKQPFKSGFCYLSDYAGNISGPYMSTREASGAATFGDICLIAVDAKTIKSIQKTEVKKNITEISIDFVKKSVTIVGDDGADVSLAKTVYLTGTTPLDDEELKEWDKIIEDANKHCKNTIIIGTPPIQGELLDALLHM